MDKERLSNLTERIQKIPVERLDKKDRIVDKKETVPIKKTIKPAVMTIDDFACNEELDFKPVEKKSIVPEKKYTAEKTTSKFDFAKVNKEKKKDTKELKDFEITEKVINQGV